MKTNIVNIRNINTVNARSLILKLLTVVESGVLTVAETVRAGALFNISENNSRVALARLTRSGLVESIGRGSYRLGSKGYKLGANVAAWKSIEDQLMDWDGSWIAVATGSLPRSNRKALRARDRALSMLGMREVDAALFIRPNNFRGGVCAVRKRLVDLGLSEKATVFVASEFDITHQQKAMNLWKEKASVETYLEHAARLNIWMSNMKNLPLQTAARESYLLGDEAIHRIVFDPMLPAPFVDENARYEFIESMKRFDDRGKQIWAKFLNETNPDPYSIGSL